jgi:predicted SAM-dependent methyltransferase
VCGYDPFVSPQIRSSRFVYAKALSEIPFKPRSVDLILSVTVLDHITDDMQLHTALALVYNLLKDHGHFLMLEYALDADVDDWRRKYSNGH